MKNYFKRLKDHPGLEIAVFMSFASFCAGAGNKSVAVWWHGGLVAMAIGGGLCWAFVLISNFEKRK